MFNKALSLVYLLCCCFLSPSLLAKSDIVNDLNKSKTMFIRKAVDDFSLFYYLGDLKGKSILDLGAEYAFYSDHFHNK